MTCKEVAKRLRNCQNADYGAKVFIKREAIDQIIKAIEEQNECYERAVELLKATQDLLKKQKGSYYVLNLLEETVYYDEAECDGNCLLEDIGYLFEEMEFKIDYQAIKDAHNLIAEQDAKISKLEAMIAEKDKVIEEYAKLVGLYRENAELMRKNIATWTADTGDVHYPPAFTF